MKKTDNVKYKRSLTTYNSNCAESQAFCVCDSIRIRPITLQDTGDIVKWRNDPRVRHNFIYQEKFTTASHNEWMMTKVATGLVRQFIIETLPDRIPVGSVYFRDINMNARTAEYGIFIGEECGLHRGYANLAAGWAVDYARKDMGLRRLILRVFADNGPALKSYMKAGFRETKRIHDFAVIDGKHRDLVMMEIILQS